MKFNINSIPLLSSDVITRKDKNGILLFQVHSDEMYFVSFAAYEHIISKCDGSKTIDEIINDIDLTNMTDDNSIHTFFRELESRQIIVLW